MDKNLEHGHQTNEQKTTFQPGSKCQDIFTQYLGEFEAGSKFLAGCSNRSPWIIIKLIDSILRGIGQVCFANNPISGIFCLIGLFLGSPYVACSAVVASIASIVSAMIFDQPLSNVRNGLNQFNSVLIGTVLCSLYPVLYNGSDKDPLLWILIIVGSMLSVPIQNGIGNLLASLSSNTISATQNGSFKEKKLGMVAFTFPFNVIGQISFVILALQSPYKPMEKIDILNSTHTTINWLKVAEGSILSMGQVYAVDTLSGSILMIFGFALCSPILSFSMVLGGSLGTITALGLLRNSSHSLKAIYGGIYGYNAVLTAGALGGFFTVLTLRSIFRCIAGVILTVMLHIALETAFARNAVIVIPICTLPFVIGCWMLHLNDANSSTSMPRVSEPSVPEVHLIHHLRALKTTEESRV